ncbi:MAG: hypothetical protein ACF8XB_08160 [Planctomycetota bacterium JB042]
MRERAALADVAEQADEAPEKGDDGEEGKGKGKGKGKKKHGHHDHVWTDGPHGPGWWNCHLWKGDFHGPYASAYPPSCSWYPNWFGGAPCWSPAWWCAWWPLYSVHPGYVHCVPTYVPVYQGDVIVYQPYDEFDVVEEFVPVDGELPEEGVDPFLEAELLRLSEIEAAVRALEEGAQLFLDGLYAEATDAFRRAMLAAPDNAIPKFAMANGLFALGEYGYAAFLLRRGVEIVPTWPSAGPDLRELYGDEDDLLEHQIALEVTVESLPNDGELRLLAGYVAFFTGDLDTAEHQFRALLALAPDDAFARTFLGRIAEIRLLLAEEGVSADGYEAAPPPPSVGGGG